MIKAEHPKYTKVIITVKSNTANRAAEKSLRSLDLMRAILAFYTNYSMAYSMTKDSPINTVRVGKTHTLHDNSGVTVNQPIYYDPNFIEAEIYSSTKQEKIKKLFKQFKSRLEQCKYSDDLKTALLLYIRALDEKDPNTAFIRVWGALERLAAPSEGNYDSVTKRCSFIFKDTNYNKQILEHLREYRNQSIHAGQQIDMAKTYCYWIQYYFQKLIYFHLRNVHEFDTLAEANMFLDFSDNIDILKKREKLTKKAIKYRQA